MPRSKEQDREYQRLRRAQKAGNASASSGVTGDGVTSPASGRVHRSAVTRMLRATGLAHSPEEAPLVELVKALALEMDQTPSASTSSRYRAALADVRRVLDRAARQVTPVPAATSSSAGEESEKAAPVSSLQAFKDARGIGAG